MSRERKTQARKRVNRSQLVGENLSFEALEAYKLLRTNLTLSLPAGKGACRLIGITSSVAGEGKSTTAINLAYSLGKSGKRVLLLEADMRKPVTADVFGLPRGHGLSNLLTGSCNLKEAVATDVFHLGVAVLPAGDVPPNPAELLNSSAMQTVLEMVSKIFDYIILDLPPVTAVSDALAMSDRLDGMIVVVRKDYCDQRMLAETMRRLEQVNAKILGFVMTDTDIAGKKYKKYGYGKYGYR